MSTSDSSHEDEVYENTVEDSLLSKQTPTAITEKIDDPTKSQSPSMWEETVASIVDTSSTSNDQIDFSISETTPFV
jgi:hypothetical protein